MLVKDNKGGEALAPAEAGVICHACGASVEEQTTTAGFCTNCESPMGPDAKFCGQFGTEREG